MKLRFERIKSVYFDLPAVGAQVAFAVLSDNLTPNLGRAFSGELMVNLKFQSQADFDAVTQSDLINTAFAKIAQELPEAMLLTGAEWQQLMN
ncbi:hypothetical protein [Achromobacter spanius]|uniref:hypothetical protein n=1 Tax=Achromobacter spanius TaxID=217203 RepID=UPI000A41FC36|nr:hypothetical protein [Achromobacter spanius]